MHIFNNWGNTVTRILATRVCYYCGNMLRSSRRGCSVRGGALRNFANMHRKTSLFLNRFLGWDLQPYWKETLTQVFSCKFWKISKNTFFTEHFRVTASLCCFTLFQQDIVRNKFWRSFKSKSKSSIFADGKQNHWSENFME